MVTNVMATVKRCAEGGTPRGRGAVTATQGRRLGVAWHAEEVNGWAAGTLGDDTTGPWSD